MLTAVLLLLVGLVLIALIIAANGYFVAQEFAYMSVDRSVLRARAENGDSAAVRALKVTERTSFMLSGAQLGITVTGLLVGYVAEPFIGEAIRLLLGGAGVPAGTGIAVGTIVALVLATVVQMIFGELFPKNLAIASPTPLARALAGPTLVYLAVFGWLIFLFDKASNALLRLVRVEPVHDLDSTATAEELARIVDDSRHSGHLPEELSMLLDRILDFPDRDVEHAMIPRSRTAALGESTTVQEARSRMAVEHTRYPVIDAEENPIGVIHLAEVLSCAADDQRPVATLMRDPLVIPELMRMPDALNRLLETGAELACVIDEHGGFTGVLTMEDLAEELVGEITDEHDPDDIAEVETLAENHWRIDGSVHIDELERVIGTEIPAGEFETVAGLLISVRGGLLEPGEHVTVPLPEVGADYVDETPLWRSLHVEVLEVERYVPVSLVIELREEPAEQSVAAEDDRNAAGEEAT